MAGQKMAQVRHRAVLVLALCVAALGACQFKGDRVGRGGGATPPGADAWRIEPVRMRVHPTTRVEEGEGPAVLSARIELFDEMGDPVKAVGHFDFVLYASARPDHRTTPKRLAAWGAAVLSLDEQRRAYESISRTYLFRLLLPAEAPAIAGSLLDATFTAAAGRRLHAEATLGGGPRDTMLPTAPAPLPPAGLIQPRSPLAADPPG